MSWWKSKVDDKPGVLTKEMLEQVLADYEERQRNPEPPQFVVSPEFYD